MPGARCDHDSNSPDIVRLKHHYEEQGIELDLLETQMIKSFSKPSLISSFVCHDTR